MGNHVISQRFHNFTWFLNDNTNGKTWNPSNLGILDQNAALHWVQQNITAKVGNIFLDPIESADLVEYPQVGRILSFPNGVGVEESCKK